MTQPVQLIETKKALETFEIDWAQMVSTRRRTRQMTAQIESSGGEASQNQNNAIAAPELAAPRLTRAVPVLNEDDVVNVASLCPNLSIADRIGGCIIDVQRQLERIASRSEAGSGELRAIGAVIDAANVSMRQSVQEDMSGIKQMMAEVRTNQLSIRENINRIRLDMKSQNTHILIEVRAMIEESEKRRFRDLDRVSDSIARIRDEFRDLLYVLGSRENESPVANHSCLKRQLEPETAPIAKKSKQSESGGEPLHNSATLKPVEPPADLPIVKVLPPISNADL